MNVALVGYRGTGKSAVARLVGERLGLEVVSLDAELEQVAGQPIPRVVAERGWSGFRDLEEQIVQRFAGRDGLVLDCGGGVVEREGNFGVLRSSGVVILLTAKVATIVDRIAGDTQRPSLTGRSFTDEVAEVLERRRPLYERLAHHRVPTDGRSLEEVAAEIVQLVRPE